VERFLKITICLLVAALAWVVAGTLEQRIVTVGDDAPSFLITTDSGRVIKRSDFGGKLLVLNFWATWCPPCLEELPSLNRFAQEMAQAGVVVLGVSVDTNQDLYRRFLARTQPSFLTARDPEANISASYGTFKYPETYVIDRSGKVLMKVISSRDWTDPELISSIKRLL
jgi:peroxiredoxin